MRWRWVAFGIGASFLLNKSRARATMLTVGADRIVCIFFSLVYQFSVLLPLPGMRLDKDLNIASKSL